MNSAKGMKCPICKSGTWLYRGKTSMTEEARSNLEEYIGHPISYLERDNYVCNTCRSMFVSNGKEWTLMGVLPENESLPGAFNRTILKIFLNILLLFIFIYMIIWLLSHWRN